ncbi:MAG TPA: ABC transporter ATP-binding protein [Azospirillaceae bacterium]|nr:ABC transporter ATP-binding protein [Azospirillaceae bacterium]
MSLLHADRVTVRAGTATLVDGATLSLQAGQLVGLVGPNGAGKTTLLGAMAGLTPVAGGTVLLEGRPLPAVPAEARARAIGYVEQGATAHWPLRAERVVALGRLPHRSALAGEGAEDRDAVARAMALCGVDHLAARVVTTLSGGERARVMLARALAGGPRVLLADEPVSGLDPGHQLLVMRLLAGLAADGMAVAVVLHDLALAVRFCHRLCLMEGGRVAADGPPEEVLRGRALERAYGIELEVGRRDGQTYVLPWNPVDRPAARAAE